MTVMEIKVILKCSKILRDPEEIRKWLHVNLRQFKGKTALQMVRAGQGNTVLAYLDSAYEQYVKETVVNDEVVPHGDIESIGSGVREAGTEMHASETDV